MARLLRIEYPGAVYHVTSRGNNRADIFLGDDDRQLFLNIWAKVVRRFRWVCHAYCLMTNHYHLLIETPEANLAAGMRQLNGLYTQAFNRRHGRSGHLLQGRYKAILIEKESHLLELCRYIVRNPVAADMVPTPEDWPWSSYLATAGKAKVPDGLTVDWVLAQFGAHRTRARSRYGDFVRNADEENPWDALRGGVLLGSEEFVDQMEERLDEQRSVGEIRARQRLVDRPPLAEIVAAVHDRRQRAEAAYRAHVEWGYTLKEIGAALGVHYATVSRLVKVVEARMCHCKT